MSELGVQIQQFVCEEGKSATKMTKALKFIGNGDMATGINKLTDWYQKDGQRTGRIQGSVAGVVGTILVFGLVKLVNDTIKANRKHKNEGEKILKELSDGTSIGNEENDK